MLHVLQCVPPLCWHLQAHLLGAGHAKLEMWKKQPPCSSPCWGLPKLQA